MNDFRYKVYVVVDRSFGSRLDRLERGVPVWIVESADNKSAVQRLWRDHPAKSHLDGVTMFVDYAGMPTEEVLLGQLDNVDLHHGIHSANPPYAELEVVGTTVTPKLRTALAELGFDHFQDNPYGFVATRPTTRA